MVHTEHKKLKMTSELGAVTEMADVFTPGLLLDICVNYVTSNMCLVETLNGIPEIIGERLLDSCVQNGNFHNDDEETRYCIQLFVDAYGREFMESLRCARPQFVNEYCGSLTILCMPVTHLDVSGCQLGNNNDFLRTIGNMKDLKVLNLSRNELSEDGFRLLLGRYRMYKEGFQALESCDVSENIVTLKTLNTFLNMPQLKNLRVSVVSSLKVPKFVQGWTASIRKSKFRIIPMDQMIARSVTNKGLGVQIISVWERKIDEWEAARLRKVEERNKSFYTSLVQRSKNQVFKSETDSEKFDTYSYVRDSLCSSATCRDELVAKRQNKEENSKKRKWDMLQASPDVTSSAMKRKEHDLNMDLLKMYRS